MAITYTHDPSLRLTLVSCSGLLTAADLAQHWAEIYADAEVIAGGRLLIDLRECTIGFSGEEVVWMATRDWPAGPTRSLAMAVLVRTPEQFDAARQFQLLAREGREHQIFFEEAEAMRWILKEH